MGKKLYVGNLPFKTTEGELEDLFGEVGRGRFGPHHHGQRNRPGQRVRVRRNDQ